MPLFAALLILFAAIIPTPAQVQSLEAWWIDMGETDSTVLGTNIAPLVDINGDSLNDFLVGSWVEKAFIYLGSTEPDTIPYLMIPSPADSVYQFAVNLYNIGDVNGDGSDDFIIGARISEFPLGHLICYLYFGGEILDSIPDLVIDGPESFHSTFGSNGVGIGDFNGDGGKDFILLDHQCYNSDQGYGLIYLYYGGEILDSIPDWTIHGGNPFSDIGQDAAPLGDVNDDGFNDFVMVDWWCDGLQGEENAGVVAVYYGGAQPDTLADIVIYGEEENAGLGRSVDGIDFDRDGQKDIVVGSGRDYPPNHSTSIYVYLVSPDMDDRPDFIFPDESGFGYTTGDGILGADLNGDGWPDIVSCNPTNVLQAGKVYVYLGGANPDTLLDAYYFQGNLESSLGAGGCNAGDVNGDGIDDLIIGEPGYNYFYTQNMWGRIHVIQGDTAIHQSVGVEPLPSPGYPVDFSISISAFPNPFNEELKLKYALNIPGRQTGMLQIYNIQGEVVKEETIRSGEGEFIWNARRFTSGIYFARATAGNHHASTKIVLIR